MTQAEKAVRLLQLHHADNPLVLVNAWDAGSARIVEHAGFPAVATSSAGVACAQGHPDGQSLPWNEMVACIRKIARTVQVPVTADIEAGFASDLQQLQKSITDVIAAGAVGINLEDALPGHNDRGPLYPLADQLARIQAVRAAAEKLGVHLLINARVDAYWQTGVTPEEAMRNTLERGKAYLKAGADCIFVPGLRNPEHIRKVVEEFKSPVNILAFAGSPSIRELKALGVKRVSLGSGPMRAAMGFLRRIAQEVKDNGTYELMLETAVSSVEMNGLFRF